MYLRRHAPLAALALLGLLVTIGRMLPAADDATTGAVVKLKGHKEAVYGVAFSPDGKFVLTASGDPSVKVWSLPGGKEIKGFGGPNGHRGIILGLAVSPDGTQFATAGADNTARVWDFPTSKHLREFALANEGRRVAVSPDGTRVAGGDKDGKVCVWNAADGKRLYEVAAHSTAVSSLAFSGNGQTLASGGADGTLRFLTAADGKTLAHVVAHSGPITGVGFHQNNTAAYTTGQDGTIKYWSLPPAAARPIAAPLQDGVTALTMTSDGTQVAVAAGRLVRLANVANGQVLRDLGGATGAVQAVTAGPTFVAAGTADHRLLVWQTKDGQLLGKAIAHAGPVTGVAFNAAGNQAATVGKDGMLRLWAMPPAPGRTLRQPDVARAAALSADGKRLATAGADKLVRLYKLDNLKAPERQLSGHTAAVNAVALSPDGKLVAGGGDDEVIRFWDQTRGDPVATVGGHTGPITGLTFVGGTQVLSCGADGVVKLWRVPTPSPKGTLTHAGAVTAAALSPDGTRALTGSDDKQVRLWNLRTGQTERTWTGPGLGVLCVAYSPRSDRVAAGSADKGLFVWDVGSNKEVKRLTNLPAAVTAVALTADGKHAAAGLADGSVRVYDLTSGKEVKSFTELKAAIHGLELTPRGDQVVYAGADGQVHLRAWTGTAAPVTIEHGAAVQALALSRDGARVAIGGADKQVKVYTLATGKAEATFATPAAVRGLSFSADGKRLAVAGGDGRARLYTAAGVLEEFLVHDGAVNAAHFAPDGRRLLTASADKTARTWTPALVWQGTHAGTVRQAIVSPRGDRVLSAGADGVVRLWNLADGKPVQAIRAHDGAVNGVAISADAARIVTAGADRTARIFELAKLPPGKTGGKTIDAAAVTLTLPAPVESVSISPNGQRIAVGVKETVRVYDGAGKELLVLGEADAVPARQVTFLADNRTLLAAGSSRNVELIDVHIVTAFEAHKGGATAVVFHSNGNQVLTGGGDGKATLWTVAAGKADRTFGPFTAPVSAVAFSRDFTQVAVAAGKGLKVFTLGDGKEIASIEMPAGAAALSFNSGRNLLAVASADGRTRVYDVAARRELVGLLHGGSVTGVAFHPATPTLLVSGSADKTVAAHTLTATRVVAAGAVPADLAVAPSGTHLLVAGGDGKVGLFNTTSGNRDRTFDTGGAAAVSVAVSRNGALVAVGTADRKVRLFNYNDGKLLSAFTAPAAPRAVAFSPTGQALVAAGADGSLTTWDTRYTPGQPLSADFGKVLQSTAHAAAAHEVAFPTVGAMFYTAGSDRAVKAWKLASDAPTRTFNHPGSVNAVAINAAGTQLATGCADGRVRVFDLAKGTPVREIVAHTTPNSTAIYCVAFSPDGKQVVSGSMDQSLKLFNVADGKRVREFKAYKEKESPGGHQEPVLSVAFSPDGQQIASGGMDRTIKLWRLADGSVKELANPAFKVAAGQPPVAHPGWVYALRFTDDGKKLISAGGAPRLRGYLAAWDADGGRLLWGKELPTGTLFGLAVSPDGRHLALGAGGSVRATELNLGLVLPMPAK